jgi:hypothetical protein
MKRAEWIQETLVPLTTPYCLCVSEKQFIDKLKELKVSGGCEFIPHGSDGVTRSFENELGGVCNVVCIHPRCRKYSEIALWGILTHEAVHIWQHCMYDIGEDHPGGEIQAYGIQQITENLISLWGQRVKKGNKK